MITLPRTMPPPVSVHSWAMRGMSSSATTLQHIHSTALRSVLVSVVGHHARAAKLPVELAVHSGFSAQRAIHTAPGRCPAASAHFSTTRRRHGTPRLFSTAAETCQTKDSRDSKDNKHGDSCSCASEHLGKPYAKPLPALSSGRTDAITPHECWDCHKRLNRSAVVCKGCKRIQPLYESAKYFDLMLPNSVGSDDLGWRYNVDLKTIKKTYLMLQQFVHPDAWVKSSDAERSFSEQQSSFINKAYSTYLTPLARSMYLLEQHGEALTEADKAQDQKLLMSIVEYQEDLEDLADEIVETLGGDKDKSEEYKRIKNEVDSTTRNVEIALSEAWGDRDLPLCKSLTIELRYWSNLKKMVDNWVPGQPLRVEH